MNKEKIRVAILQETEKGAIFKQVSEENFIDLDLGFDWFEFKNQVEFLVREGYLTKPFYADDTIYHYNSQITEKGENFLESSKWYKKLYNGAKEIKEWIK